MAVQINAYADRFLLGSGRVQWRTQSYRTLEMGVASILRVDKRAALSSHRYDDRVRRPRTRMGSQP
jgi:hypothetical protein